MYPNIFGNTLKWMWTRVHSRKRLVPFLSDTAVLEGKDAVLLACPTNLAGTAQSLKSILILHSLCTGRCYSKKELTGVGFFLILKGMLSGNSVISRSTPHFDTVVPTDKDFIIFIYPNKLSVCIHTLIHRRTDAVLNWAMWTFI